MYESILNDSCNHGVAIIWFPTSRVLFRECPSQNSVITTWSPSGINLTLCPTNIAVPVEMPSRYSESTTRGLTVVFSLRLAVFPDPRVEVLCLEKRRISVYRIAVDRTGGGGIRTSSLETRSSADWVVFSSLQWP